LEGFSNTHHIEFQDIGMYKNMRKPYEDYKVLEKYEISTIDKNIR
jgi:hypothetical protein